MRNLKRILSVIMLILMLFNIIQPVFAVSGSGKWAGGQYDSGMKTTDNQNQSIFDPYIPFQTDAYLGVNNIFK